MPAIHARVFVVGLLTLLAGCTDRLLQADESSTETETGESETETGETSAEDTGTEGGETGTEEGETETETSEDPFELSPEDLAEIDAVAGELEAIVEGALAYFALNQPEFSPPHRCPHPDSVPAGGEAGFTPDLGFNCNEGPEDRCVPIFGGGGAGFYDMALWVDNNVWQGIGWSREEQVPHAFHYNFLAVNLDEGTGACEFTAIAHADFDDDAVFSTYSISGYVDEDGATVEPLVVDMPFE